jgi:hypothetical protein
MNELVASVHSFRSPTRATSRTAPRSLSFPLARADALADGHQKLSIVGLGPARTFMTVSAISRFVTGALRRTILPRKAL